MNVYFANRIHHCKATNQTMMAKWYFIIDFVLKRRILSMHLVLFYAMKPSKNWIKIYVNLIQLMMHNAHTYNGQKRFNSSSLLVLFFSCFIFHYLFLKLISHCNLHLHFLHVWSMKLLHQIKLMCTSSGWFWLHLLLPFSFLVIFHFKFDLIIIIFHFIEDVHFFTSYSVPLRSTATIHAWI